MTPLQCPSDLPVDRPAALAQGISRGQTQADIIEVNSHSSAQLVPASDWNWKSALTPEQMLIEEDGSWRRDLLAPSAAWDNDWERSTACWDPWARGELKGTVLARITDPHYPAHFGDADVSTSTWPLFMRLKEHHCISPQEPVPAGGPEDDLLDDGVRNAWFPPVNLTTHRVCRPRLQIRHHPNFACLVRVTRSSLIPMRAICGEQNTKRLSRAIPTSTMKILV